MTRRRKQGRPNMRFVEMAAAAIVVLVAMAGFSAVFGITGGTTGLSDETKDSGYTFNIYLSYSEQPDPAAAYLLGRSAGPAVLPAWLPGRVIEIEIEVLKYSQSGESQGLLKFAAPPEVLEAIQQGSWNIRTNEGSFAFACTSAEATGYSGGEVYISGKGCMLYLKDDQTLIAELGESVYATE